MSCIMFGETQRLRDAQRIVICRRGTEGNIYAFSAWIINQKLQSNASFPKMTRHFYYNCGNIYKTRKHTFGSSCLIIYNKLTPWLMEPGGSMPHSQGLSNNPYPELNQPNYPHLFKVHSDIVPSTPRPP